jgi:hypothetical protein
MAIINIKEGINYNSDKVYEKQTQEFKDYANELYENIKKIPYPDFDEDGNISYLFEDDVLNYKFIRIQVIPFSTSNRGVKNYKYIIKIK